MKILVLTPTFLPAVGGAELVLFEVYRRLAARHQVVLLTPLLSPHLLSNYASEEYGDEAIPFAVRRYRDRITFFKVPGHRLSLGALPPFSLSAVAATSEAIRDLRPDVLNVHYLVPTGLAGWYAARRHGIPTVMTMNGRDVPGPGVPRLWRWWQRALLAAATDVTYVSGYCKTAIYGPSDGLGRVIYNGVAIPPPAGDAARARRRLGLDGDRFLIFALGRLAKEKRVDVLVRAMRRYLDAGGEGSMAIGGTGPESESLERLAKQLDLGDRLRFCGFIPTPELADYFAACDAFTFHSTYETFGIVIAQAMSYGKPVITARNTALPEVLGDAGLLADACDPRGFAAAFLELSADVELRRRLGAAGRRRAEELFDWDKIALQYEAVLERAAARGGP
jgi:glycosyltransferase involved in cell wall biosynthesis